MRCFPSVHPPVRRFNHIRCLSWGADEIYLFGPFSEREEVFLETEKHTGQIPVKLSTVPGFT